MYIYHICALSGAPTGEELKLITTKQYNNIRKVLSHFNTPKCMPISMIIQGNSINFQIPRSILPSIEVPHGCSFIPYLNNSRSIYPEINLPPIHTQNIRISYEEKRVNNKEILHKLSVRGSENICIIGTNLQNKNLNITQNIQSEDEIFAEDYPLSQNEIIESNYLVYHENRIRNKFADNFNQFKTKTGDNHKFLIQNPILRSAQRYTENNRKLDIMKNGLTKKIFEEQERDELVSTMNSKNSSKNIFFSKSEKRKQIKKDQIKRLELSKIGSIGEHIKIEILHQLMEHIWCLIVQQVIGINSSHIQSMVSNKLGNKFERPPSIRTIEGSSLTNLLQPEKLNISKLFMGKSKIYFYIIYSISYKST